MSKMTEIYQQQTASLMATAPDELREYVCRKVLENIERCENCSSRNVYENQPVCCRFVLDKLEGDDFWIAVELKKWDEAMSTEFWQSYKENQFKVSTQSNLTQAYLLIVDYKEHSVYINPQSAFDKASEIIKNTVPPPTSIEVRGIDVIGVD